MIVNYTPIELFDPSTSYLDLASICHDLNVGPYSHNIFPVQKTYNSHKREILKNMREKYLLSHETVSVCPLNMEFGEHKFQQQTFLLLIAHIEGEF